MSVYKGPRGQAHAYLNILAFRIGHHDLYNETVRARRQGLLTNVLHKFAEFHRQPLFALETQKPLAGHTPLDESN